MAGAKGGQKSVSVNDIQLVQNMIERCLQARSQPCSKTRCAWRRAA